MKCSTCGKMNCMAHGGKVDHERGVHKPLPKLKGVSGAGEKLRDLPMAPGGKHGHFDASEDIKNDHQSVLDEMDEIKPNLKGLAEGGEVEPDMGEESDHDLMDACASEFMDGHEKKDKKQMCEALKAIWHSSKE